MPAPVFLHGLCDSRGRERMVTVYALANNPTGFWTLVALARDPLTTTNRGIGKPSVSTACWPMSDLARDMLVIFAGQVDRGDPARLTLRAAINGREVTISGVLQENGSMEFTSSDGLQPWDTKRAGPLVLPALKP